MKSSKKGNSAPNFGLKLWSTNFSMFGEAKRNVGKNLFQYLEITWVPNTPLTGFVGRDIPGYVLHAPTEVHGVNFSNPSKMQSNLKMVNRCLKWADKLNARYLIIHPGYGNFTDTKKFFKNLNDERILLENEPKVGLNGEKMTGYAPEPMGELIDDKFGLCLDFGHAIKAAVSLKKDYKKHVQGFLKFGPKLFHISDGRLNNERDEHLNIGEGDYDFRFLMGCVKQNKFKQATLETPNNNFAAFEKNLKKLLALGSPRRG